MPRARNSTIETPSGPRRLGFKIDPRAVYELSEIAEILQVSRQSLQEDADNLLLAPTRHRFGKTFVSGATFFKYISGDDLA